eukprot:GHUV01014711.1.p1 GENE.GHUV01014711.1~~GHUV01014711.1.p1  ORF type:complete len:202 (+),score=23.78 GHUV01014711.1:275-880(+)
MEASEVSQQEETASVGSTTYDAREEIADSVDGPSQAGAAEASVTGKRVFTEGIAPMPLWAKTLAAVSLLCFIAWIYVIAVLMLLAPFSSVAAVVVVAVWSTVLFPCSPVHWKAFLANPIFALWRRYFNYSVCYEQKLDAAQHFLYADFPHGAFPLSQLLGLTIRHKAGWEGEPRAGTLLGLAVNLEPAHIRWGSMLLVPYV